MIEIEYQYSVEARIVVAVFKNVSDRAISITASVNREAKGCRVLSAPDPGVLEPGQTLVQLNQEIGVIWKFEFVE